MKNTVCRWYHANDTQKCELFLKNDEYLICSEDRYYLGTGMYFWDNLKRAKWWLTAKKHNHGIIVSANINCNNVLDTTDEDILASLNKLYADIREKIEKHNKFIIKRNIVPLGVRLDILFDFCTKLQQFTCIYGLVKYENRVEDPFLKDTPLTRNPKSILLVKKPEIISDKKKEDVI